MINKGPRRLHVLSLTRAVEAWRAIGGSGSMMRVSGGSAGEGQGCAERGGAAAAAAAGPVCQGQPGPPHQGHPPLRPLQVRAMSPCFEIMLFGQWNSSQDPGAIFGRWTTLNLAKYAWICFLVLKLALMYRHGQDTAGQGNSSGVRGVLPGNLAQRADVQVGGRERARRARLLQPGCQAGAPACSSWTRSAHETGSVTCHCKLVPIIATFRSVSFMTCC